MLIDEMDLDILKEIVNIGASTAATSLSKMMGMTISVGVSQAELIPFSEMSATMDDPERPVLGILVQLGGQIEGFVLMIYEIPDAVAVIGTLLEQHLSVTDNIEEMLVALEPMKEICNIMTGAYISAISSMTDLKISPSVPEMTIDMGMAIMNIPIMVYGQAADEVLVLSTSFGGKMEKLEGKFFLLPTIETFGKFREALLG